jgi:hypothetical protein
MRPALQPGDWALALAIRHLGRYDVVVAEHPERPGVEVVKRVIALPGEVAPDGRELGADELWLEGDASEDSTDSRHFGPVRRDRVTASVRFVYWPPERWGLV